MATAGNTLPFPDSAPGLAAVDGAVTITTAGTSVPVFAAGVGGDQGWYRIQCNVDGASVYFDGQYQGATSGGSLYVPVYTTGTPYSTIRVEKSGYHTYTASLPSGPAAGETREVYVTLQPVAPGDTVTTVSVSGVPDNASFSLTIRNVFATTPGEAFEFTIRDLSLPFSLNSGEVNAYTRGTDWTELVAALPDGGSVIMRLNSDDNGEVRIAQPRDIPSGTFVPITFQGKAAVSSLVADFTILGTKQGPDDGQISFTIEGIEQGIMTGSVYVDGSEILSWGGSSGGGAPEPTPTPMWTPTPSQTPAVPRDLGITSNKDTVVRGNSFTVTITGESGQDYFLTLQNPGAQPPTFRANQVGVTPTADPTNVTIRTTAAGTRSVELTSTTATREASYTLRVTDSRDANRYDEVRVRVETGSVTITTSGTGVYYLGEELVISGTNTDSNNVYLFLTGPNLPANGVRLDGSMSPVENNNATSFTSTPVEADDTWSYKWDTGSITRSLDAGGYTIYAISEPRSKESLSDVKYGTTTIQLRPPSLTARPSSTTLIPGGEYWISGTATGNPPNVNVWIFGKNYYGAPGELHVITANVESDGTFECVLTGAETSTLQKGQYYVIVQHPGSMGFGVAQGDAQLGQNTNSIYRSYYNGVTNVFVATLTNLQAPEAANALISALESPYVDDIYIKFSFTVGDASWIRIDGLGDQTYGETFMVAGTTSFPAGKALAYWITEGGTVALSDVVVVTDNGDWNFEVDTTVIGPGAFTLHITAPEDHASAIALFDVYDDIVHPVPPGGGSYRVERLDVTPSLDSLTPGDGAVLDGVIRLDDTLGSLYSPLASRTLEFSTDLQDPVWSYNLRVDGNVLYAEPMIVNARSFALSGWDLDYQGDVRILLSLSGTTPSADSENPVLLRILEREGDGRVVPNSEHRLSIPLSDDPAPLSVDNLTLSPGWNFVSIPRPLAAGNDTAAIFSDVKADGHSAFRYDTAHGTWMNLTKTDRLAPLEGYWIYSAGPATVPLNFSTDPLISPAERALAAGWNAVGITGSTPATARDAFHSVKGQWSNLIGYNAGAQAFEIGIVNDGTGANADTRSVYPGRGYWLSMTGPGTLYAIGA
ncbi:PEGA domain-containing protein [Methanoculleus sp. Afa-1]|uniref:PEGA domain-containing protein n=2 Tax=Methanoculleus formosensis TaxID=2590886 RepID=A0A9E4ZKH9_9EURY|nr:PEGA domain-containing protein [Methanoculleus sp. Afa-1]